MNLSTLEERLSNLEKSERYKKIFSGNPGDPDFNVTENLFKNLDTLCQIKKDQKLYVNQDLISTDHTVLRKLSSTQSTEETETETSEEKEKGQEKEKEGQGRYGIKLDSVLRWYLNESRINTLKKIRSIIKDVIICGYLAIESFESSFSDSKLRYKTIDDLGNLLYIKRWEIVRSAVISKTNDGVLKLIITKFRELTTGLSNLKVTYKDDIEFVSSIDIEIEIINNSIKEFEEYIDIMDRTI